ncbi:hypothetical protein DFP72DRAFT_917834, partial [Ephemerocybe angulata]
MTMSATPEPIDGNDVPATNSWSSPPPAQLPGHALHDISQHPKYGPTQRSWTARERSTYHSLAAIQKTRPSSMMPEWPHSPRTAISPRRRHETVSAEPHRHTSTPHDRLLCESSVNDAQNARGQRRLTACPASSPMKEAWTHHRRRRRATIRRPILSEESR